MAGGQPPGASATDRQVLDLRNRTATTVVAPETAAPGDLKFIQIEVGRVRNPRLVPLSFEVHLRPASGEEILLGSFALFPPDNPGTFIVATEGRLEAGATVRVTLTPLEPVTGDEEVRVWIESITYRTQ